MGLSKEDLCLQSTDSDFSISTNVLRSQSMLEKLKIRNKQLMRQELAYLKRNMQKSKNEGL